MDIKSLSPTFSQFKDFGEFVMVIVRNGIIVAGIIAFFLLIFGGFTVIVSAGSGDSKEMEKAKQTVTMAVIGFLLVVFAFWILQAIQILTGTNLTAPTVQL